MLQVYVSNVSSASDVCCIQVFHVASVSCFRGMFRESWGHGPGTGGRGVASRGVLVLIPAHGSHPRGERGGCLGEGATVKALVWFW